MSQGKENWETKCISHVIILTQRKIFRSHLKQVIDTLGTLYKVTEAHTVIVFGPSNSLAQVISKSWHLKVSIGVYIVTLCGEM